MLRRDFKLTADVVFAKLINELVIRIVDQIIEPYPGTDKHLFYTLNPPQLPQKRQILPVADFHIPAWRGEQALLVLTSTMSQLLCACRRPEIGRRSAHIVDISLKIRLLHHLPGLCQNRFLTPCGDNPPLMKGQSTEVAAAEAAP